MNDSLACSQKLALPITNRFHDHFSFMNRQPFAIRLSYLNTKSSHDNIQYKELPSASTPRIICSPANWLRWWTLLSRWRLRRWWLMICFHRWRWNPVRNVRTLSLRLILRLRLTRVLRSKRLRATSCSRFRAL